MLSSCTLHIYFKRRKMMKLKSRLFAVVTAAILSTSVFSEPVQQFVGAYVTAEAATTVATPTASRKSASYYCSGTLQVTLSCATPGATIYYSTNGGSTYKQYTKPVYFAKNGTIKFYAKKNGVKSAVASRTYKLVPKFTVSLASGTYTGAKKVYISSPVSGAKFYYTLDGSTPTTASKLYTAQGITINASSTLKIRTYKSGWSAVISTRKYTINKADSTSSIIEGESLLQSYKSKYAYNTLNDKQKQIYAAIYEGVQDHSSTIDVRDFNATLDDVDKAFFAMDYENPQFFWLKGGYSYSYSGGKVYYVQPKYGRTAAEAAKIMPVLEAAVKKIGDEAMKKETLFEKVKYIHDTIINGCDYTLKGGEYIRDADGALINGQALCEGYAKAFAYICQSIGIEAFCVGGKANGGLHMWNLVKLDGSWYHMDVTFDDPISDEPMCEYTYFGLTTTGITKTHKIDNPFVIPTCTATKYNYYKASGTTIYTNANSAYMALIIQATKNYNNGVMRTTITCSDACVDALYTLVGSKGNAVYTDLKGYGCSPASIKYGYNGTKFYLQLS